jgi:methyl-accepting chemotaxis protein
MSDDTFKLVIAGGVLLAALCFLVQTIVMTVLYKTVNRLKERVEPLAEKTGPMLEMMRHTTQEVMPRIVEISADAVEISKAAREQVTRVGELLTDFSSRAKAQVARIDGAVEQTVGNVQMAGETAIGAVLKPVREVNGMLAGIKTAISVYSHGRRQSVDHATQDEEMFI